MLLVAQEPTYPSLATVSGITQTLRNSNTPTPRHFFSRFHSACDKRTVRYLLYSLEIAAFVLLATAHWNRAACLTAADRRLFIGRT